MSRVEQDIRGAMSGIFNIVAGEMIVLPVTILMYGTLLFSTSPRLAVFAGAGALMHFTVSRWVGRAVYYHNTRQYTFLANVTARLQDNYEYPRRQIF